MIWHIQLSNLWDPNPFIPPPCTICVYLSLNFRENIKREREKIKKEDQERNKHMFMERRRMREWFEREGPKRFFLFKEIFASSFQFSLNLRFLVQFQIHYWSRWPTFHNQIHRCLPSFLPCLENSNLGGRGTMCTWVSATKTRILLLRVYIRLLLQIAFLI